MMVNKKSGDHQSYFSSSMEPVDIAKPNRVTADVSDSCNRAECDTARSGGHWTLKARYSVIPEY